MGDSSNKNPVLLLTRKFEPAPSEQTVYNDVGGDKDVKGQEQQQQQQQQQKQHSNLTKSILKLTKKGEKRKRNSEQRTEFAPKVSEFTFKGGEGGSVKVDLRDLSRPLTVNKTGAAKTAGAKDDDKTASNDAAEAASLTAKKETTAKANKKGSLIHKEVRSLKARQPARAPLVKHLEEKLLRKVGYNVAVDEVKKWKGVVKRNREAETVSFPLEQPSFNVSSTQELVKRFKPRTPLELEVAKLLHGSESVLGQDRILTVREERALNAMDLEEAKRKRAELQKIRSLQSYAQVRSKRQGKIKSKRYHRRLRKAKEGENAQIYEELEKSHPERFQEMLDKMERKRVEERMNQRHKNNSKWVKSMMKLGKKDSEARTALNEALETNRKLTEKPQKSASDDEEDDDDDDDDDDSAPMENGDEEVDPASASKNSNNPWLSSSAKESQQRNGKSMGEEEEEEQEEENISSMYPKLKEIKIAHVDSSDEEDDDEDEDDDDDDIDDEEKFDAEDLPTIHDDDDDDDVAVAKGDQLISSVEAASDSKAQLNVSSTNSRFEEVDPTKIILKAPEIVTSGQLPTLASYENGIDDEAVEDDAEDARRLTIEEAFADDDVVAEFAAAKSAIVERETPKPVCTALPGWGDWVGGAETGISEKRKKRFTSKLTPDQRKARYDADKPRVIFNEKQRDPKLAKHQVSDIPTREFNSVQEFEKSIRAPVGRTFNAEAAYQKLIVPSVTTKAGTVIDPINKERTFLRKEAEEEEMGEEEEEGEKRKGGKKRKRDGRGGGGRGNAGKQTSNFKKADQKNRTSQKAKKMKV